MIILFFLLTATLFADTENDREEERRIHDEYVPILNKAVRGYLNQVEADYDLCLEQASGCLHKTIESIDYTFRANRRATVDEARALELTVLQKLIDTINNDESIRPYLDEYPFGLKHVWVSIVFKRSWLFDSNIRHVIKGVNREDDSYYIAYLGEDGFTYLSVDCRPDEPYEEALKQHAAIEVDLKHHQEGELERILDQILPAFKEEIIKEFNTECWSMSVKSENQLGEISANLVVRAHATQEQARGRIIPIIEKLLHAVNSDSALRPFIQKYPLTSDQLKISLNFTDQKGTGYYDGSMEGIKLEMIN